MLEGLFLIKRIFYSILIFIFIFSCSKEKDTLLEDMAFLDKQYIKTILIVRNMDQNRSGDAISAFMVSWNIFKDRYYNINREDRQWQSDFDAMQDILISSGYYVLSGEDISASYSILHDGKYVLSDMRKRNNINWFIDDINSIYKTADRMKELAFSYDNDVETYNGAAAVTKKEEELVRVRTVYDLLVTSAEKTMTDMDKSNVEIFNIPDNNLIVIIQNISTINNIIMDINDSITINDYKSVILYSDSIINIYFNILSIIVLE